ncbi:MAG TPA: DEAD/DEAH box helicase [Polyangia bacterium]|nr:DEAD/DEAH box helicase [Polyangia bacterium]
MKVETLEAYNVPSDILAVWRQQVGADLLPVQERAIKEFGLFAEGNLIVFSPTSSGKTFVGEMAAVKAARGNTKVLYLVPQKALAVEKFEELRRRYSSAGIKVVVSSRDRREHDDDIERGDFHIAVVVFEKVQALLIAKPQLMDLVGLVVVDELQMITDKDRGPTLELLLTKLRIASSKPRIIGLSAVLGRAQSLADWLGARLLVDQRRPVDLRKGVLCRGEFRYQEHNSGKQGVEPFADFRSEKREELFLAAVEELARRGEQVLAFVPDRATTVLFARVLSQRLVPAPATAAAEELRNQEETLARETLLEVLGSAVAFHNSDLSPEEREIVERHFRDGSIRALFSTSTLAVGMNLPVKNVVLDHQRWEYLRRYGRWSLVDISRSEYENMSGRAGRLSLVNDFGRSILVTYSPFEADVWLQHFAGGEFEEIRPTLAEAPLENHVLDLMASGFASSRPELEEMLLASFTGWVHWAQKMSRVEFGQALDKAVAAGLSGGLLRAQADDRMEVTAVGRVCAAKGIGVATGAVLAMWAKAAIEVTAHDLEVLMVVSQTPVGQDVYVALPRDERWAADYRGKVLARAAAGGITARPIFAEIATDLRSLEYDTTKVLKKALLMSDWIEEVPTQEIEGRYHTWAGAIRRIGEEYGWLVDALAGVARATGWPETRSRALQVLADRLAYGVLPDALPLARLRARGVGRALLRRMVDAGFGTREQLKEAGPERVRDAIRNKAAFTALWIAVGAGADNAQAAAMRPSSRAADAPATVADVPGTPAPVLTVNLREYRVFYRGVEIPTRPPNNLQRQPLLALAVLAENAGASVSVSDLAASMHRLGGLSRRPVAPEARDLRYRILRPFRRALKSNVPRPELDRLVESIAGDALRLNVAGPVTVVPKHGERNAS